MIILATVLATLLLQKYSFQSYSRFASDTLHYEKAVVVEVSAENITYDEGLEIRLGTQEMKVEMLDGEETGEIIDVTNYLTQTHNVYAKEGTKLIINADRPEEGVGPYYTVYNYDRSLPLLSCFIVLGATVICIGGGKGVKSIAGLVYSLYLVVYMVLPAVFSGYSPILMSVICGGLSTAVTLLLLNGNSEKTWAAVLSTVIGVICSLLFFLIMSSLVHIDGFSSSEAEGLVLIHQETGLRIKDVLFAGVLISSLGAIMDTGMSIVSALYEVYTHNPGLTARELFRSGIEMGKDMIGTMTNTLILAFTGSAFITLLVFLSYQVQANQLFNSNYLTIEIAQGVCGTFGIVLTVPVAAAIAALLLTKKKRENR
nr:YibE/F family protein [Faecalicatena contorta]